MSPKKCTAMTSEASAVELAETYYDSSEADAFYKHFWGGEDIHIGLYDTPDEAIAPASHRTVARMASKLAGLNGDANVLDLGAGYGGSARHISGLSGCRVTCLNISETQNALNREKNASQGLEDRISVKHGSFEDVPEPDALYDIVWSQDAFLHSADRPRVLDEINRVLKPGGEVIFTDPMQADDCPDGVLQPILDRIHLATMGSFAFYKAEFEARGFETVELENITNQLRNHYSRVREELENNYEHAVSLSGREYVDNMIRGLGHWVDGADKGYLAWGILHFRKAS